MGSTNFPTTSPLQPTNGGAYDAFVTKIGNPPTAVALCSFVAARSGPEVVLRWRTASEATLLGFHVYRQLGGEPQPCRPVLRRRCMTRQLRCNRIEVSGRAVGVAAERFTCQLWDTMSS